MPFQGIAVRLEHIHEAITDIEAFVAAETFDTYVAKQLVRRAVERSVEIISEASRHIPEDLKERVSSRSLA